MWMRTRFRRSAPGRSPPSPSTEGCISDQGCGRPASLPGPVKGATPYAQCTSPPPTVNAQPTPGATPRSPKAGLPGVSSNASRPARRRSRRSEYRSAGLSGVHPAERSGSPGVAGRLSAASLTRTGNELPPALVHSSWGRVEAGKVSPAAAFYREARDAETQEVWMAERVGFELCQVL